MFYLDHFRKLQSASSISPSASPANRSPDSQSAIVVQVFIASYDLNI